MFYAIQKQKLLLVILLVIHLNVLGSYQAKITMTHYGNMPDGKPVYQYTLVNVNGMRAHIINYGGIVVRLMVPDKNGELDDVVLGLNSLDEYREKSPYFGAIVGRYANRIANGKFNLDEKTYTLAKNNAPADIPCHLHGGEAGFDKKIWDAVPSVQNNEPVLTLKYISPDGEEGYPGRLEVTVIYTLTSENGLRIQYSAISDQRTIVNLTNHSYFNLKGEGNGDILDHQMQIFAPQFTPVNKGLIPTGEIRPVKNTPFDFLESKGIGARINEKNEQLKRGNGYDHNWVLYDNEGDLSKVARIFEPQTGRVMEIWTTEPGLQFYSGNFLDGSITGKSGKTYTFRSGFCLEPQHFPDSPNNPDFPSVVLEPGDQYAAQTIYRFCLE